jgi:hypothetical protein
MRLHAGLLKLSDCSFHCEAISDSGLHTVLDQLILRILQNSYPLHSGSVAFGNAGGASKHMTHNTLCSP